MSTDTLSSTISSTGSADSTPSFLDRWFSRFIEGRVAAGERRAQAQLRALSPEILAGFGLSKDEVAAVRATGKLPANYWAR